MEKRKIFKNNDETKLITKVLQDVYNHTAEDKDIIALCLGYIRYINAYQTALAILENNNIWLDLYTKLK